MQTKSPEISLHPLSEKDRLVNLFTAPGTTFNDIRRSASWWLPFVISSFFSLWLAHTVLTRIGIPALVQGILGHNTALAHRIDNATPQDAEVLRKSIGMQFELLYVQPVLTLVYGTIGSAVLMITVNVFFGLKTRFASMIAVWFYGTLPLALYTLVTLVAIYFASGNETLDIHNAVASNAGYFIQSNQSPRWIITLLSSIDIFSIWSVLLLTIGIASITGLKRSHAAAVVFGWWLIYVLGQTLLAVIAS